MILFLIYIFIGIILYVTVYCNTSQQILDELHEDKDYPVPEFANKLWLIFGDLVIILLWPLKLLKEL